jgi:hypothetical protein
MARYTREFAQDRNNLDHYNHFISEVKNTQNGKLMDYFGTPDMSRVLSVSTAPQALPTIETLWKDENVFMSDIVDRRINAVRTWLTAVVPLSRDDNWATRTQLRMQFTPMVPEQIGSLMSVKSNEFEMGEKSWNLKSYGLGAKFELNMLRGPGGQRIYEETLACLQDSMYLGVYMCGLATLTSVGRVSAGNEKRNGGSAFRTVTAVLDHSNMCTFIYHKSEKSDIELDIAIDSLRTHSGAKRATVKILPYGTLDRIKLNDFYTESDRVGSKLVEQLIADPKGFSPFSGTRAVIEEDLIYAKYAGENEIVDPLEKKLTFGFKFFIGQNALYKYEGGKYPSKKAHGSLTQTWDDGVGSWFFTSAIDYLDHDVAYDPTTDMPNERVLRTICDRWEELSTERGITPRTNEDGDPLLDPFITYLSPEPHGTQKPSIVALNGQSDPSYDSIEHLKKHSHGCALSMEYQMGSEAIAAIERMCTLLNQAYSDHPMKASPTDYSLSEAFLVSSATYWKNAPLSTADHITRGNMFGCDHLPPLVRYNGGLCISDCSQEGVDPVPLFAIWNNDELWYGPISAAAGYQSQPMMVTEGFIPPGGGTFAHAFMYHSMYRSATLNQLGYSELNPEFYKSMYEGVKELKNYNVVVKEAYSPSPDDPNIGPHMFTRETNVPAYQIPSDYTFGDRTTYFSELALSELAFDFYKPPVAVGGNLALSSLTSGSYSAAKQNALLTASRDESAKRRILAAIDGKAAPLEEDDRVSSTSLEEGDEEEDRDRSEDFSSEIRLESSGIPTAITNALKTRGARFPKLAGDSMSKFARFRGLFNEAVKRTSSKPKFSATAGDFFTRFMNDSVDYRPVTRVKENPDQLLGGLEELLKMLGEQPDARITGSVLLKYVDGTIAKRLALYGDVSKKRATTMEKATKSGTAHGRWIVTRSVIDPAYWRRLGADAIATGALLPVDPLDPTYPVIGSNKSLTKEKAGDYVRQYARGSGNMWSSTSAAVGSKRGRTGDDETHGSRGGHSRSSIPSRKISDARLGGASIVAPSLDNLFLAAPVREEIMKSKWMMTRVDEIVKYGNRFDRAHALLWAFAKPSRKVLRAMIDNNLPCPRSWNEWRPFVEILTAAAIYTVPNAGETLISYPLITLGFDANIAFVTYRVTWGMGCMLFNDKDTTVVPAVLMKRYIKGNGEGFITADMSAMGNIHSYGGSNFDYSRALDRPEGMDRIVCGVGSSGEKPFMANTVADITGGWDDNLFGTQDCDRSLRAMLKQPSHSSWLFLDLLLNLHSMNEDKNTGVMFDSYYNIVRSDAINTLCYQGPQRGWDMDSKKWDIKISDGTGPIGTIRTDIGPILAGYGGIYSIQTSTAPAKRVALV